MPISVLVARAKLKARQESQASQAGRSRNTASTPVLPTIPHGDAQQRSLYIGTNKAQINQGHYWFAQL